MNRKKMFLWVIVAVLSVFLGLFKWMDEIGGVVQNILLPINRRMWEMFKGNGNEIDKLKEELVNLQYVLSEKGKLVVENKALREQLSVSVGASRQMLMARTVGGGSGVVRIDQGKKSGVKRGMMVIYGRSVIGRITSVSDWSSWVSLPTSSDFRMVARVVGGVSGVRRADGLVVAKGGRLWLTKVLSTDAISEGDLVVSMGDDLDLGGLILGKIIRVGENKGGVYQEAEVQPEIDGSKLSEVFVLLN